MSTLLGEYSPRNRDIAMHGLSAKEEEFLMHAGEAILGVPKSELGERFLHQIGEYLDILPQHLVSDIHKLLWAFDSKVLVFLRTGQWKRFTHLDINSSRAYLSGLMLSGFPLFRTGFAALKAFSGWGFYSLESAAEEIGYPGKTIGREHVTPTLLRGREPWRPGMEVHPEDQRDH